MIKSAKKAFIFLVIVITSLLVAKDASADAWWGEGYRSPDWVISNGGTLIYFNFKNASGNDKNLKINLYTASGAVIETEREDRKGVFDDGVAGQAYYLKAKDGDKKVQSKVFVMKRGSTNYATVNMKSKDISIKLAGNSVAPKKVVNKKPVTKKTVMQQRVIDQELAMQKSVIVKKGLPKKKRAITVFDPKLVGKSSRIKKEAYNSVYSYYKIDYKKMRDNKFKLKVFAYDNSSSIADKKIAKNK
jgi:hypothetical protein